MSVHEQLCELLLGDRELQEQAFELLRGMGAELTDRDLSIVRGYSWRRLATHEALDDVTYLLKTTPGYVDHSLIDVFRCLSQAAVTDPEYSTHGNLRAQLRFLTPLPALQHPTAERQARCKRLSCLIKLVCMPIVPPRGPKHHRYLMRLASTKLALLVRDTPELQPNNTLFGGLP